MKVVLRDGRVWEFVWKEDELVWEYRTRRGRIYYVLVESSEEGFDIWIGRRVFRSEFGGDRDIIVEYGSRLGVREVRFLRGRIVYNYRKYEKRRK